MDDGVENYLTDLARTEHEEPVLVEMEARASEFGFPSVGRATGRYLELVARAVGARRVMELGSGYGYSALWFARAVGPDGNGFGRTPYMVAYTLAAGDYPVLERYDSRESGSASALMLKSRRARSCARSPGATIGSAPGWA